MGRFIPQEGSLRLYVALRAWDMGEGLYGAIRLLDFSAIKITDNFALFDRC
jgi:hypothetical protein